MNFKTLFFVLCSLPIWAQPRVSGKSIYQKRHIAYGKNNKLPFSGIVEQLKDGSVTAETFYDLGVKTKYMRYYNVNGQQRIREETYFSETGIIETEFSEDGQSKEITHYDASNRQVLFEAFKNDTLIYSCQYKNGRKNGREFCVTKECADKTDYYKDGKLITKND